MSEELLSISLPEGQLMTPKNYEVDWSSGDQFILGILGFGISETRSRHKDTVYASCALSLNGNKLPPAVRRIGDLNNGVYRIDLYLPPITIDQSSVVVFEYALINAGHGNPGQVEQAISSGLDDALSQSSLDEPWKSIARAAVALGNVLFFADCDGPLAYHKVTLSGADIIARVPNRGTWKNERLEHPGGNSPSGCRKNSRYDVSWTIIHP